MIIDIFRYFKGKRVIAASELFDPEWYERTYSISADKAAGHYFAKGYALGYDPSPLFSTRQYLARNTDVRRNGMNPLYHYELHGKKEGRACFTTNSTERTQITIPDYVYGDETVLEASSDTDLILNSVYFNASWYRRKHWYTHALFDPAGHYLRRGFEKLLDPSPEFSGSGYLYLNPDAAQAGCNPLLHYELNKRVSPRIMDVPRAKEQLKAILHSRFFDSGWYGKVYGISGGRRFLAKHYFGIGITKNYDPGPFLSTSGYKLYNGVNENPLFHIKCHPESSLISPPKDMGSAYRDCMYVHRGKAGNKYEKTAVGEHEGTCVDIIICVHNALPDVKLCLQSVLENTHPPVCITVINDNSNDETRDYLLRMEREHTEITVITNDTGHHGYTYAANIGLRHSTADYCVLLNSDTIVTDNWVNKMLDCFDSDPEIGIVGPLSNTASWQSVPLLNDPDGDWAHNVLPTGFNVDRMGKLIEKQSERQYPIVPLLNGFCLMISRRTINAIGYFDEKSFGRGFAEEDDYNIRAGKAGLKLAIADDTYIFHAQSKSYTDDVRRQLSEISGRVLREKHGTDLINQYCHTMQFSYLLDSNRKRTEMNIRREQVITEDERSKYSGLRVGFLLPAGSAGGGSNIILNEASCLLKWGVEPVIINLKNNKWSFEKAYNDLQIPVHYVDSYEDVEELSNEFDCFVCTLYSTVSFCKFAEKKSTPRIIYYIQDFEPFFFPQQDPEFITALKSYSLIENSILVTKTHWNADMVREKTGRECLVLGPSVDVDRFRPRKHFPQEHPLRITAMIRPNSARRAPKTTYMVLREIKKIYGERVQIRFFGNDPQKDGLDFAFFKTVPQDFIYENLGILSPDEMSELLSDSEIFVDFSTYQAMGLTAMEAMCSGCAVIMPINGGTSDYARHGENSLLVDTGNYDACLQAVKTLINDSVLRNKLSVAAYADMLDYYPEKAALKLLKTLL